MSISKRVYQRTIPFFIAAVFIGLFNARYYTGIKEIGFYSDTLTRFATIIATVAGLYGTATLLVMRANVLRSQTTPFHNKISSISFYVTFFTVVVLILALPKGRSDPKFTNWYALTIGIVSTCTVALRYSGHLYATYRMFTRIRSIDAIALFASFALTLLRTSSLFIYFWPPITSIGDWIYTYPHVAASRACTIAAAVGGAVMGIRALFMKEPAIIESELGG